MIIVDPPRYQELFRATGNEFSMMQAYIEDFHFPSVFRADCFKPIHSNAIRSKLTHDIPILTPQIVDEVNYTIGEEMSHISERSVTCETLANTNLGWTPIVVYKVISRIVARESLRAILGIELCTFKRQSRAYGRSE